MAPDNTHARPDVARVGQVLGTSINGDYGQFFGWVRYIDDKGVVRSASFRAPEELDHFLIAVRRRRQQRDRSFVSSILNKDKENAPTSPQVADAEARSWLGRLCGRKSPYSSKSLLPLPPK